MGRFISEDSVRGNESDPLSLNLYTYCGNNPILLIDPSGQSWEDVKNGFVNFYVGQWNDAKRLVTDPGGYLKDFYTSPDTYARLIFPLAPEIMNSINFTNVMAFGDEKSRCEYLGATGGAFLESVVLGKAFGKIGGWTKSRWANNTSLFKQNLSALKSNTVANKVATDEFIDVTRWGRPGLESGDWVMRGKVTWWNYFRSFKWQPGMGNQFAAKSSGEVFQVPKDTIKWPKGWGIDGWWKGLFGQRQYMPKSGGGE